MSNIQYIQSTAETDDETAADLALCQCGLDYLSTFSPVPLSLSISLLLSPSLFFQAKGKCNNQTEFFIIQPNKKQEMGETHFFLFCLPMNPELLWHNFFLFNVKTDMTEPQADHSLGLAQHCCLSFQAVCCCLLWSEKINKCMASNIKCNHTFMK